MSCPVSLCKKGPLNKITNANVIVENETNNHNTVAEAGANRRKKSAPIAEVKPEKIRAELNIEKWPAIWNPTHSKNHSKVRTRSRTLERESTGPDGTKTISKVTINPIGQLEDLTTDDRLTFSSCSASSKAVEMNARRPLAKSHTQRCVSARREFCQCRTISGDTP